MYIYVSNENGNWRQQINRVVNDEQKIFFKIVDDEGDTVDISGAEDSATIDIWYANRDSIVSGGSTSKENSGSTGVVSYTPDATTIAKMFKRGCYYCQIKTTIDSVDEKTWNRLRLYLT